MHCQQCESELAPDQTACSHCGAQSLPRRGRFDPAVREFSLTVQENDPDLFDERAAPGWNFAPRSDTARGQPASASTPTAAPVPVWGGFIRRACALIIDGVIVLVFGFVMGVLSYIGYEVGLAAHGRAMTATNSSALISILVSAWLGLAAGYFIMFHGMTGKTPGKQLLGLRVVGADKGPITYGQAFIRWLALVLFAPILLGFLWVLWSLEKRAWHDRVALTWVIRD